MNVFISHAAADRNAAKNLARMLKAKNFTVTSPYTDLGPGENWALKVGEALEEADAMVVLLSPSTLKSEWVQHEIGYALASPKFAGRLIPVVTRPTKEFPWILHNLEILRASSNHARSGGTLAGLSEKIAARLRSSLKTSSGGHRRRRESSGALTGT